MRWLDRVLGRPEKRAITLSDFGALGLLDAPGTSGVTVNERTAYGHPSFWNGVYVISSQTACSQRAVYKRLEGDERERDRTTPAARLMAQPNEMMTDVVFWETMMAHALTWGNMYAEIEFDRASRPIALWPIAPDTITPVIENKRLRYRIGSGETIPPEIIFHVPGLGFDGLKGYSVVHMLREALAQGMAVKKFGASFFGNGATLGLTFEHPGTLSDEAYKRLIQSINDDHRGPGRAHKTKILEEGMKAKKVGIPPEDAQFLETQEFDVEEVARILNINPVKLKSKTGERPGGNFESIQIEFLTDTLRPWWVRIEQEANRKLFPPSQRSTYYVEHLVDSILRVDNAARMAGYKALYEMKVISSSQIARKENLPEPEPDAGPPALPAVKVLPQEPMKALPPANDKQMRIALRALVADAAARFSRREAERVKRAAKRGADGLAKLDELYADEAMVLRGYLAPAVRLVMAHAGLDGDAEEVAGGLASAYVERSKEELLALPARNVEDSAGQLVARWETGRPLELAERVLADYGGSHA